MQSIVIKVWLLTQKNGYLHKSAVVYVNKQYTSYLLKRMVIYIKSAVVYVNKPY